MIVDAGDELIEVPSELVTGIKSMKDGSTRFKLFGGKFHDMVVRVYEPYTRVVFNDTSGVHVYTLIPPIKKGGKWVYAYDPEDKTPYTAPERGYDTSTLNEKWAKAYAWITKQKEIALERLGARRDLGFVDDAGEVDESDA